MQGGGARVSQEKEGVRQMSGKPRSRAGKPKQDTDRGAESTERHILPQSRVAAAAGALKTVQKLLQLKKKKKTPEQKIDCFNCSCFFAHSGLTYAKITKCCGGSRQLELASFALVLNLCSLHVKTLECSKLSAYCRCHVRGRDRPMRAS